MAEAGGRTPPPPDFGRIEGTAGQRRRAALLLAHPDFQTLRHPWAIEAVDLLHTTPGATYGKKPNRLISY